MSYRLKVHRSLVGDVRRVASKQLTVAISELQTAGQPKADDVIHEARRRVKKTRALIRLVRPALGDDYELLNRRLRAVNRMLASIADGEAVVEALVTVAHRYRDRLPKRTVADIRAGLLAREQRIGRKAIRDRLLLHAAAMLRRELATVATLRLNATGFRAVAGGFEDSVRRARRAARAAEGEPTLARYHAWRRRTKDLWLQLRLLRTRCRNHLVADERRLETLDGLLGEYHDLALLERLLVSEPLVSRQATARCLHLLRRDQTELRRRAITLGRAIAEEKPRHFVRRVRRYWHAATWQARTIRRATWRRAA
jgi:CHAD domain